METNRPDCNEKHLDKKDRYKVFFEDMDEDIIKFILNHSDFLKDFFKVVSTKKLENNFLITFINKKTFEISNIEIPFKKLKKIMTNYRKKIVGIIGLFTEIVVIFITLYFNFGKSIIIMELSICIIFLTYFML
jgi:hypothetical protein